MVTGTGGVGAVVVAGGGTVEPKIALKLRKKL